MTSGDQNLRASFRNLDAPVAVDPAFAERIRAAICQVAIEPEPAQGADPIPTSNLQPPTRFRLQDLAAAAVLVLVLGGLIAGAIRLLNMDEQSNTVLTLDPQPPALGDTQAGASPEAAASPATAAAGGAIPVINAFGSAANVGNLPGVMPPLGSTYELLWEAPAVTTEQGWGVNVAHIAGPYVVHVTGNTGSAAITLSVHDLETGSTLWEAPSTNLLPYAITPRGLLVAQPERDVAPLAYGLALLDLATGEERWQTPAQFEIERVPEDSFIVSGPTVYVLDGETRLVALDLATGEERWIFDAAQGRTREEMLGECTPQNPECGGRSSLPASMAIVGDVAYRYVPLSGELVAVNTGDGSLRWSVSAPERLDIAMPIIRLIGTQLGVIPVTIDQATGDFAATYIGLWTAADGTERWTQSFRYLNAIVIEDQLYVSWADPEAGGACCQLSRFSVENGELLARQDLSDQMVYAWYAESRSLVIGDNYQRSTSQGSITSEQAIVVIDPANSLVGTAVPADEIIPGCAAIRPGMDGEHVVCTRPDGQTAIYRATGPAPVPATPAEASASGVKGCFERGDVVTVTEERVNLRGAPEVGENIIGQVEAGADLSVIGNGAEIDPDGSAWCRVRENETALTGYIAAEFLERREP